MRQALLRAGVFVAGSIGMTLVLLAMSLLIIIPWLSGRL